MKETQRWRVVIARQRSWGRMKLPVTVINASTGRPARNTFLKRHWHGVSTAATVIPQLAGGNTVTPLLPPSLSSST